MTRTKKWLITAASLILIGCIIFVGVMTMLNWNFKKLSTIKYETNTHEIDESFKNISVSTSTANITFKKSSDSKVKIISYEESKAKCTVDVTDGTLAIKQTNAKEWYDYVSISFDTPRLTVYLPEKEYGDLTIKESTGDINIPDSLSFESIDISLSTGDIKNSASAKGNIALKSSTGKIVVENISAKTIDIKTSTGKITASDISCKGNVTLNVSTGKILVSNLKCNNFSSTGSTGSITLENVISEESFNIKRSTGDVEFKRSDAKEINIKTDTGNVTGSLLTPKIFITKTDTGNIDVPKYAVGTSCEITTDTGNIEIEVLEN